MSDTERAADQPTEPPGKGDSIEDAAREAVEQIEKSGTDHAGTGDYG